MEDDVDKNGVHGDDKIGVHPDEDYTPDGERRQPFCSDALDGFRQMHLAHLESARNQLQNCRNAFQREQIQELIQSIERTIENL